MSVDVLVERHSTGRRRAAPELALERPGRLHRPGAVADRSVPQSRLQEHAQAPVVEPVTEEEEVAAAEPRREVDGQTPPSACLGEVVDVVVLADDEALTLAVGAGRPRRGSCRIDRPLLERYATYAFGTSIDARARRRPAVQELPAVAPDREVRDDVERLASVVERALERAVVAAS